MPLLCVFCYPYNPSNLNFQFMVLNSFEPWFKDVQSDSISRFVDLGIQCFNLEVQRSLYSGSNFTRSFIRFIKFFLCISFQCTIFKDTATWLKILDIHGSQCLRSHVPMPPYNIKKVHVFPSLDWIMHELVYIKDLK